MPGWDPGGRGGRTSYGYGRFRPMAVAELVDGAVRLYRRNLLLIVAIGAIVQVPFAVLQFVGYVASGAGSRLDEINSILKQPSGTISAADTDLLRHDLAAYIAYLVLVYLVQYFVVQPLQLAPITSAVSERYLGRPASIGGAYRATLRRLRPLATMLLLQALALLVPIGLLVALALAGGAAGAGIAVLLGLAFVIVAVVVGVRWTLAAQVIVVEGTTGAGGLRRSWALLRGAFWRTLGIRVLLSVLVGIVSAIVVVPVTLVEGGLSSTAQQAVNEVVSTLATVMVTPITLVALALLYYDMRIRREAFDLEMLAASL